jgi:hypothetical protein
MKIHCCHLADHVNFQKDRLKIFKINQTKRPVICDSMRLHLLFSMVETEAPHIVSIKSYSENTHLPFFSEMGNRYEVI